MCRLILHKTASWLSRVNEIVRRSREHGHGPTPQRYAVVRVIGSNERWSWNYYIDTAG